MSTLDQGVHKMMEKRYSNLVRHERIIKRMDALNHYMGRRRNALYK
jgi:hypothetical protein